jgi:hypothetical protein
MKAQHLLTRSILLVGLISAAPAFGGSIEPARATFASSDYVTSTNGGSDCNLAKGEAYPGILSWPGAAKTGAVWRYLHNLSGVPTVVAITLPKTPAATSTQWAGAATVVSEPGGTPVELTFSADITYINTDSFVITDATYSFGNCTETFTSALASN